MAFRRLHGDDFYVRIFAAEKFAGSDHRAAGAERSEQVRDFAFRLLPNLRAGSFEMCFHVLGVLILVGHGVFFGRSFRVRFGQIDGTIAESGRGTKFIGNHFEVRASDF